ncbi:MAG TPA: radical SAM protein [Allosphingosinicella sp.]|nr:radical SAM protein [Allosphingosinicella sp.]
MRVTIIDLAERGPTRDLFKRRMSPNFASIMPQAVAVWCEEMGHDVRYLCYTGTRCEDLTDAAADTDVLFLCAYTLSAFTAYALSAIYRGRGAVTVLGGPHARCYPEDAARHFDYVLGLTGRGQIAEILGEAAPRRPLGRCLSAPVQPREIPNLRQRWKYVEPLMKIAGPIKLVPMIGSFGCPYSCSFCIDAAIPYQPLDFETLKEDLRFVRTKVEKPIIGWQDPNFGVRFSDYLDAIEEVAPPGSIRHIAEMSLSLLTDDNLARLQTNGFVGLLPGIESWYDYGNKSKATRDHGLAKVEKVADHVNRLLARIPFVQTNFIQGLDCDAGDEPFELTRRFMELTPGAYPAFSLFTCYGRASPLNLELQRAGRVNAMAFHFLDSNHGMNIKPLHYGWADFYEKVAESMRQAYGLRAMGRRLAATGLNMTGLFSLFRSMTSDRARYQAAMARMLREDGSVRAYFEGETRAMPSFFEARVRKDLGPLWDALPPGALEHDPHAYVQSEMAAVA